MRQHLISFHANSYCVLSAILVLTGITPLAAIAGSPIDRVYHPYVEALEREVEWRVSHLEDDPETNRWLQSRRLAYGQSVTAKLYLEAYLLAAASAGESLQFEGFELEAKYQLTEQGEYWADWAVLVEIERETSENIWEVATAGLLEKELGRTSLAANLRAIYAFGNGADKEFELETAVQWRLRGNPLLEPAVEIYLSDSAKGVGPVIAGAVRLGGTQLKYEAGSIFAIDDDTADVTYRFMLEFEF